MLDKVQDFAGKAQDQMGSLAGQAQDYLGSDHFKKIMPYLLSGGAGAVLGGVMSGRRRKQKGEGRLGYMGRILKNALIGGGMAAGGHYLLGKGIEKTVGGADGLLGEEGEPALEAGIRGAATSPLTAAAAGGTALLATAGSKRIGMNDTSSFLKQLAKQTGTKVPDLEVAKADEISKLIKGTADPAKADRLRRMAGLASTGKNDSKIRGILSWLRRKPGAIFGQSNSRMLGRGMGGLVAAGLPAIAGTLITRPSQQ